MVIGVLCGGPGLRMGTDKATLRIAGESLLERMVRIALATGCRVAVSGRRRPEGWPHAGIEFVRDEVPFMGPLHGIARLLDRFRCDVLAVGCDMPLLTTGAFEWLIKQAPDRMLTDGLAATDSGGRLHPLFSIYTSHVLALIDEMSPEKSRAVRDVIRVGQFGRVILPPDMEPMMFSVNPPDEFEYVRKTLEDDAAGPRTDRD